MTNILNYRHKSEKKTNNIYYMIKTHLVLYINQSLKIESL